MNSPDDRQRHKEQHLACRPGIRLLSDGAFREEASTWGRALLLFSKRPLFMPGFVPT